MPQPGSRDLLPLGYCNPTCRHTVDVMSISLFSTLITCCVFRRKCFELDCWLVSRCWLYTWLKNLAPYFKSNNILVYLLSCTISSLLLSLPDVTRKYIGEISCTRCNLIRVIDVSSVKVIQYHFPINDCADEYLGIVLGVGFVTVQRNVRSKAWLLHKRSGSQQHSQCHLGRIAITNHYSIRYP